MASLLYFLDLFILYVNVRLVYVLLNFMISWKKVWFVIIFMSVYICCPWTDLRMIHWRHNLNVSWSFFSRFFVCFPVCLLVCLFVGLSLWLNGWLVGWLFHFKRLWFYRICIAKLRMKLHNKLKKQHHPQQKKNTTIIACIEMFKQYTEYFSRDALIDR